MQRLDCHVKEYAWGKKGEESEVATLFAAGHPEFFVERTNPYAELWMGTHPDGPARIASTKQLLSSFIAKSYSSQMLFNNNLRKDIHLPFIMKVMSIAKTLSLQVHPTKEQAERLHESDPVHYPDRHHKPELAYALTQFELLCGFRPAREIVANLRAFPALKYLMGVQNSEKLIEIIESGADPRSNKCKSRLAACFAYQLAQPKDRVEDFVDELLASISRGARGCLTESTVSVIKKMSVDFPGDVGIFAPLYLNHMVLQPGQCCYYASQELHAYLSGECVECVGCSNNTIRAALTPKFIDHDALIEALNYQMTEPEDYLVPAQRLPTHPIVDEYAPDCKDFQLHRIRIETCTQTPAPLPQLECASIMVVVKGTAIMDEMQPGASGEALGKNERRMVRRGDIIYIAADRRLAFVHCSEDLEAYRTFSYEIGPDHEIAAPDSILLSSPSQKISPVPSKAILTTIEKKLDRNDSGIVFEVESEIDGFC
ncbi:unnamed protein product, partial [Mesorhabditis belari]|uniref:mannose-6-phosphate isomerase n=1 Tax=Mesorhabditis belari TaxID=2138241 RepID=A0AAF3F343_9BILA